MASPVADSYSCASGGVIAGGRFAFVPPIGLRNNINLNTLISVDPDEGVAYPWQWYSGYSGANSVKSMFGAWNAAIWCPEYSQNGAIAFFGGGHGTNTGCFACIFDLTTRLWSVVGTQNLAGDGSWIGVDIDPLWRDYDLAGSKVFYLMHQYANVIYVAPQYAGAGAKGSLYIPFAGTDDANFADTTYVPHMLDLETGVMSRAVDNTPPGALSTWGSGNAISVLDTVNQKIWMYTTSSNLVKYIDLTQAHPRTHATHAITFEAGMGTATFVYERAMGFCEDNSTILVCNGDAATNGVIACRIHDTSSGWPVVTNIAVPSGTALHGGQDIAICWVSDLQKWYLYEGAGDTFCTTLTPSSLDFRTCTWAWGKESFSGVAPITREAFAGAFTNSQNAAWRHMQYSKPLKCLVWTDGPLPSGICVDGVTRTGAVQLWHPPGVPI